jgi:hypothetical protein
MKQHKGSQPSPDSGPRPHEYVIIVGVSDWSKEHYSADRFNLWDALHTGNDRHPDREPEPDLEAEP